VSSEQRARVEEFSRSIRIDCPKDYYKLALLSLTTCRLEKFEWMLRLHLQFLARSGEKLSTASYRLLIFQQQFIFQRVLRGTASEASKFKECIWLLAGFEMEQTTKTMQQGMKILSCLLEGSYQPTTVQLEAVRGSPHMLELIA